jgi:hypothetical protein
MTKKKKKIEKNLISMRQYAKNREVSYALIQRYCKQGKITLVDKKIDPELADKEIEQTVEVRSNSKLTKPSGKAVAHAEAFNVAKARREKAKADLAELEYLERAGKVVSVAQVQKEAMDLYRGYRDQMLNVVIRATKKLLGESNEFKFRKILKKEIEEAIKQVKE